MSDEIIKGVLEATDKLASVLFHRPCERSLRGKPQCHESEEKRPLTHAERNKGWSVRPFYAYNPDNMCPECAGYWHLVCARDRLRELVQP